MQRYTLGVQLYYKVMESMLKSVSIKGFGGGEHVAICDLSFLMVSSPLLFRRRRDSLCKISGKRKSDHFCLIIQLMNLYNENDGSIFIFFPLNSKLLNNTTFHTSLLACALEVVLATYVGKLKQPVIYTSRKGLSSTICRSN